MPRVIHFTKDALAALQPDAKPYRVYDDEERHLALEVRPSGEKRFLVRRRPAPGMPPRQWNLGAFPAFSVRAARDQAHEIHVQIKRREVEQLPDLTLAQFWPIYCERHLDALAPPTQRAYQDAYRRARVLHGRRLAEITRQDIARLHGELGARSHSLANKVRAALSSALGRAAEWGYLRAAPPMPRPYALPRRARWLDREELRALVRALDGEPLRDFFLLLLYTGARRSEVAAMRWDQLHLDRRLWMRRQKGGSVAPTALPKVAVELLQERRKGAGGCPWVFPSRAWKKSACGHLVEPKKDWRRVIERAGLEDVRMHDLRHTHASWMAQAGISLQVIGAQLGHRQASTTERYAHLSVAPQQQAVDMIVDDMLAADEAAG